MEIALIILPLVAILCLGGGVVYFLYKREQTRRLEWAAWGNSRGWSYSHEKDYGIADSFAFLNELRSGKNRYAKDVFQGHWDNRPFLAFTYHYETTSRTSDGGQQTHHHWMSVAATQITQQSVSFPELTIGPEGSLKRFGNLFTNKDIDFESVAFSRRFEVRSNHKKFAYEVCHAPMIEYLMQCPALTLEIEGQWIAEINTSEIKLQQIESRLHHLSNIVDLLPQYLFS